jgi:hypothetical protein
MVRTITYDCRQGPSCPIADQLQNWNAGWRPPMCASKRGSPWPKSRARLRLAFDQTDAGRGPHRDDLAGARLPLERRRDRRRLHLPRGWRSAGLRSGRSWTAWSGRAMSSAAAIQWTAENGACISRRRPWTFCRRCSPLPASCKPSASADSPTSKSASCTRCLRGCGSGWWR